MIASRSLTHAVRTARLFRIPVWLGSALLVLLLGVYIVTGYRAIREMDAAAAAVGQVIVGGRGDPALRDIPQAQAIALGHWYDDAHYAGEVHWYPFMTPLLVAWYMRVFGEPLQSAYRIVAMLLNAAILPALAVLLARFCGQRALLYLPLCALLGLYWPNDSNYPAGTAIAPFVFSMIVIGLAFERIHTGPNTGLLFAAGASAGLLALWHGASFLTACFAIGALMLAWTAVQWRAGIGRVLSGWGVVTLGVLVGASSLLLPQLLRYDTIRQADAARLYLNPELYGDGNNPAALFRLALLPTGRTALLVVLFIGLVATSRNRSVALRSAPLLVGYVVALGLGHLGFIMNSTDYPQLARIAALVLEAPPHTFAWVAGTLETLIGVLAVGLAANRLLDVAGGLAKRQHWTVPAIPQLRAAAFVLALLASYGWLAMHIPAHGTGHIEHVDRGMVDFAQTVSRLANQNSVYVPSWDGQRDILSLAPFKVVHLHAPLHSNQYVNDERAQVEQQLANAAANSGTFNDLARRYQIGFVLTMPGVQNTFSQLCAGTTVARSPQGHVLWQLHPPCHQPVFPQTAALVATDRLGLEADQEQPPRIVGIKAGSKTNFIAFPRIPAQPNTLTELRFQGTLEGESVARCLSPRAEYWAGEAANGAFAFAIYLPAERRFDLRYWLVTPENTTTIAPRLGFDPACFAHGQKITVEQAFVAQERP